MNEVLISFRVQAAGREILTQWSYNSFHPAYELAHLTQKTAKNSMKPSTPVIIMNVAKPFLLRAKSQLACGEFNIAYNTLLYSH